MKTGVLRGCSIIVSGSEWPASSIVPRIQQSEERREGNHGAIPTPASFCERDVGARGDDGRVSGLHRRPSGERGREAAQDHRQILAQHHNRETGHDLPADVGHSAKG